MSDFPELPYDAGKAVRLLAESDAVLAGVMERCGPFTLSLRAIEDPFEALFRAIVYQQLSTRAAATIFGRVLELFPGGRLLPQRVLDMPDESLRSAGMSRAKVASVNDLAAKTLDGVVPVMDELHALPDDEVVARLSQVRGIGRWTVEMLLIFNLGRPDVLPATDLGIRKGFQQVYEHDTLPAPSAIDTFGERWRPFRSVASWYLWRVVDGENEEW